MKDSSQKEDTFGEFEQQSQSDSLEFEWNYPSQQQQHHNRKTIQVIRLSPSVHQPNVIHLQPIDGHFDLVYDLFIPSFSPQRLNQKHGITNRFVFEKNFESNKKINTKSDNY